MKKYKGIIILIVVLLIYGLIMFFLFSSDEDKERLKNETSESSEKIPTENDSYYLVTDNSKYQYYNNKFNKTYIANIEKQEKFNVFVDNKQFGNYKLKHAAVWNLFDDNNNFKNHTGKLLATTSNMNTKVRDYKIREINDTDKVLLINKYNLSTFSYISSNEVVDIDLDNNGVMDEIICLSSMQECENSNNHYSVVAVKLNNEIITLIEEKGDNALYVYNIYSIINIFDREKDELIISRTEDYDSDEPLTEEYVYQYKNNKYVID